MRKHINGEVRLRAANALRFIVRAGCGVETVVADTSRKSCRPAIIFCACLLFAQHAHGAAQDSRLDEDNQHGRGGLLHGPLISVKPLDLSRTPTTEELMAAGQLGGVLYPTHESKDKGKADAAHLDFGRAIEQWNKHEYPKAIRSGIAYRLRFNLQRTLHRGRSYFQTINRRESRQGTSGGEDDAQQGPAKACAGEGRTE